MEQREQNGARFSYAESRQSSTEGQYTKADSDTDQAADIMARMAEDLKDRSLTVESIVDKYVSAATPELRQQLIDRLNQMRQSGQVPEKE